MFEFGTDFGLSHSNRQNFAVPILFANITQYQNMENSLQKVWAPQLRKGKIGSPNWKKTFLSDMSHENIENLVRRPIDQQETIETQNMLLNTQEHPLTQNFGNPS